MAKKKKAAKRTVRKARRRATNLPRKAARTKKTAKRQAAPRTSARKPASRRKAAARKATPARRPAPTRKAAASRVAAGASRSGTAAFSPAGEVYGEESWKEEELSAVELESDAPEVDELEAGLEGPEITEETDDSEW